MEDAQFLVTKKDQILTRHQREIILIENEWKKTFERSLFSSDFNSQRQGYLTLPLRILYFDFFDLIITTSKLFTFFVTLNSAWEFNDEGSL